MNPGDVWRLDDDRTRRVVLSAGTYNSADLGRVITAVIGAPPRSFDPFAVDTEHGTVYADRVAMHPRSWLQQRLGRVSSEQLAEIRRHLAFLLT